LKNVKTKITNVMQQLSGAGHKFFAAPAQNTGTGILVHKYGNVDNKTSIFHNNI
jgi:hypothetical protein